jgi:cytolethal distending toxin subunit A
MENGMKNCNAPEHRTTRRILHIACATALAVAFTGALPQPARAQQIANELMFVNAKTGKCLTIAGGVSTDNNVKAVQFDCDSDPSRRWTLKEMSGGNIYQIRNVQTGKCLTIAGGESTDNNVTALQFNCDTDLSRRWTIRLKL